MDARTLFAGKKITVMGLGLLGRGVGDIRFLAEQGAELIVTDLKTEAELAPSLEALKEFSTIRYTLGEHQLEDFRDRDLILKAPKTPLNSPYLQEAEKNGIPVTMSTALFARCAMEAGTTVVGVTGTRGKTTTTEMIAHVLRALGKKVTIGGNIRGVSTLALLPELTPDTIAVLELDSWQLQGFRAEKISPQIAVFTTLYPDHMDYYGGDMDLYLADKAEIFLHQHAGDTLVLGEQVAQKIQETYQRKIVGSVVEARAADITATLQVPGEHNRLNAACALLAVTALGIPAADAEQSLAQFTAVPGRLELLCEKDGVRFYNDNNSTTPEATVAALRAIGNSEQKNIVLIMGGDDKNLDMSELITELPKWCRAVVLFKEKGTDRIRTQVLALADQDMMVVEEEGLKATVERARAVATDGDIVLFSPAFSSFGKYFKNEYDRGDQFTALVRAL